MQRTDFLVQMYHDNNNLYFYLVLNDRRLERLPDLTGM